MNDKRITIRLSESLNMALEKKAASKNIPSSTFARSLLVTALENDLEIIPMPSLTPELDKLDPKVRFTLLRPLEILIAALRANKVDEAEIEKMVLFSVASEENEFIKNIGVKNANRIV